MGAVTARRFRDEGAGVVLTGRTREKLTKIVSQFDQGRSLIHVSDVTKPDEQQVSARQYRRTCAIGSRRLLFSDLGARTRWPWLRFYDNQSERIA
jgi:NAD(P)-dependent dehydrogenase (short-subunit alcohol dehydrogenase family)